MYQKEHIHHSIVNATSKLPHLSTPTLRPQVQRALEHTHHASPLKDGTHKQSQMSKNDTH